MIFFHPPIHPSILPSIHLHHYYIVCVYLFLLPRLFCPYQQRILYGHSNLRKKWVSITKIPYRFFFFFFRLPPQGYEHESKCFNVISLGYDVMEFVMFGQKSRYVSTGCRLWKVLCDVCICNDYIAICNYCVAYFYFLEQQQFPNFLSLKFNRI